MCCMQFMVPRAMHYKGVGNNGYTSSNISRLETRGVVWSLKLGISNQLQRRHWVHITIQYTALDIRYLTRLITMHEWFKAPFQLWVSNLAPPTLNLNTVVLRSTMVLWLIQLLLNFYNPESTVVLYLLRMCLCSDVSWKFQNYRNANREPAVLQHHQHQETEHSCRIT